MSGKPIPGADRQPSLHLALTAGDASLEIHGATRTRGPAPGALHPPVLGPGLERTLSEPASELVLFVLDAHGAILGQWGWPFRSAAFVDRRPTARGDRGRMHGAVVRRSNGFRMPQVPVPDATAFLYFMRSELGPVRPDPGTLVFHRRPLALYHFGPEPPPIPPLPEPRPTPEELRLLVKALPLLDHLVLPPPPPPMYGVLLPPELLSGDGNADSHFNLVIVGDGFKGDAELVEYKRVASLVCTKLLATEPFHAHKAMINVWSIPTQSAESGITLCSVPPAARRTYYRSSGCFDGWTDAPQFVGTSQPEVVYDAAAKALNLGLEQVHAFVVIANCPRYGGAAFPDQKLAFVDMCPLDADKAAVAVHELGHVIGRLADEYIGCCPHDPADVYPNQATIRQVGPPQDIPWIGLAESHELSNGDLTAIYTCQTANGMMTLPKWQWIVEDYLGAYWGCQDFDEDTACDLVRCDPYSDSRGQNFFRPMWDCRMRSEHVPFCRVCRSALDDAISRAL